MKKIMLKMLLAITLLIQCQYAQDGELLCDFVLNDEQYQGVYYEDMYDMLNDACEMEGVRE